MAIIYLSLGSNIGDRKDFLKKGLVELENQVGKLLLFSQIYETSSWGFHSENFLNQVVQIESELDPQSLLRCCKEIEIKMGRKRKIDQNGYKPREIDIDILFYDNIILNENELIIPHPFIQERNFILIPLMEIMPEYVHPLFNKNISQLKLECKDEGNVAIYPL